MRTLYLMSCLRGGMDSSQEEEKVPEEEIIKATKTRRKRGRAKVNTCLKELGWKHDPIVFKCYLNEKGSQFLRHSCPKYSFCTAWHDARNSMGHFKTHKKNPESQTESIVQDASEAPQVRTLENPWKKLDSEESKMNSLMDDVECMNTAKFNSLLLYSKNSTIKKKQNSVVSKLKLEDTEEEIPTPMDDFDDNQTDLMVNSILNGVTGLEDIEGEIPMTTK